MWGKEGQEQPGEGQCGFTAAHKNDDDNNGLDLYRTLNSHRNTKNHSRSSKSNKYIISMHDILLVLKNHYHLNKLRANKVILHCHIVQTFENRCSEDEGTQWYCYNKVCLTPEIPAKVSFPGCQIPPFCHVSRHLIQTQGAHLYETQRGVTKQGLSDDLGWEYVPNKFG